VSSSPLTICRVWKKVCLPKSSEIVFTDRATRPRVRCFYWTPVKTYSSTNHSRIILRPLGFPTRGIPAREGKCLLKKRLAIQALFARPRPNFSKFTSGGFALAPPHPRP
jgi:hypothetical protein